MIEISEQDGGKCSGQHPDTFCLVHDGQRVRAWGRPGTVTYAPAEWTMLLGTEQELQAEMVRLNLANRPRVPRNS